jgi:NADH:ubiquinone oxidoreductase subunit 5 (subunit L)/multisubunit Na+/H+ antiporter MnhA subunit
MHVALRPKLAVAAALAAWALAAAALAAVLVAGPFTLPGLTLDRVTAVLVVLVTGVAAVVTAFSARYLQDDPRLGRFLALAGVVTAGTVVLAAAASLTVLVAGWLVAGLGLVGLLAHRAEGPGPRAAVRRTARAFAAGDAALVAAAALVLVTAGDVRLDGTDDGAAAAALADAGVAGAVSVLLVIAALARCAQLPLGRWLPATVAAPTPVSALLHAGVVNAGGILLVKVAPVTGLAPVALGLLLAAGAATLVLSTAMMLTRADVKGALAHSTAAQMGFMLVQVAFGAAAAALVHLVGHAMYKAALFLGSGSAVAARRRAVAAPSGRPPRQAVRAAAALALPAAALAGALAVAGGPDAIGGDAVAVLLAFAWASGAHALDGWLRRGPRAALAGAAAGAVVAAAAYVALLAGAKALLDPSLPAAPAAALALAVPLVLAVVAVTVVRIAAPAAGRRLGATAYAWLVDLGSVRLVAPPPRRRSGPGLRPLPLPRSAARVPA